MPDIVLPNGKVLANVPKDMSKKRVAQFAIKQGLATIDDFKKYNITAENIGMPLPSSNGQQPTAAQRYDQERASQDQYDALGGLRESLQAAPEIPAVEEPTQPTIPFAPPQQPPPAGEGMSELEAYSPALRSARLSQPSATPSPSAAPSQEPMDLRAAIAPKPLGTETTQQLPSLAQPKLLPEEKRAEYNYYENNYSTLDAKGVEERKKANVASVEQFKRMEQFFDAYNNSVQKGYNDKIDQANFARSQGLLDEQSYNNVINEANNQFKKEYERLKINADIMNDFADKAQMDELMTARRDKEIKAQKGNTVAGLYYSILSAGGEALAGTYEATMKASIIQQAAIAAAESRGLLPKGTAEFVSSNIDEKVDYLRRLPIEQSMVKDYVTPEFVEADREKNLLYKGLYATADMVPALAASAIGGTPAMMGTFFASSYDQMGQEMQGELWDQVPEAEKEAIRIGVSAVSAGLSTMGLKALGGKMPIVNDIFFKAARKFVPNMTAGQIRRIIDAETKSYVANMTSRLAQGFVIEGTEEGIDYTQEEAVKSIYENYKRSQFGDKADLLFNNAESFREFGNGLIDNILVGGVVGNIISGSMAAVTSIGARQRLNDRQFEVFKKIAGDGSLQDEFEATASAALEKGKISRSDYDKAMEDLRVAKEVSNQIPDDLSVAATRKAFDLLTEKAQLKKKDPALVGNRIKAIDQELARISTEKKPVTPTTDAVQEPTTAEVGAQPSRTEGPREEGGGGVRPGVEGTEATQTGGAQAEVAPIAERQLESFQEASDSDADARVFSSLSIGSVLTDSSDPNNHFVVVGDTTSKRTGERRLQLAAVEKTSDGKWAGGPANMFVTIGKDGKLKSAPQIRGNFTKSDGTTGLYIMQPSNVSIPFLEVVQEDSETGETFTPGWVKDMPTRATPTQTTQPTSAAPTPTTEAAPAPALPQEIESLDDNQIVTLTYQSLDEIPDALRSKAKSIKSGGVEITTRRSILGIPVGKETKIKTPTKESYIVVASGAEIKQAAREQLAMTQPAAPAATTEAVAAPKAETLKKMNTLADLEVKSDENQNKNKQTRASAKRKMDKMLAEDARLAEVDANFDKAVQELENAGKLKVRCR
jgi:hypothetical protein